MRPSRRLSLCCLALFASVLLPAAPAAAAAPCAAAEASIAQVAPHAVERATLCLVNRERAQKGLRPLRANKRLEAAARRHARDMVRRSYFDHTAPGGVGFVTRIMRARYVPRGSNWTVGENLAWGGAGEDTPESIVHAWMDSPAHRRNILARSFRESGLAVVAGTPSDPSAGATYANAFGCLC